jgi:hypothetical protein
MLLIEFLAVSCLVFNCSAPLLNPVRNNNRTNETIIVDFDFTIATLLFLRITQKYGKSCGFG